MRFQLAALAIGLALVNAAGPAVPQARGQAQARPPSAGAEARVAIDAGAVGRTLPPLLYGQFIEHLGRCIYGGLWAEMLEDRKFYYPVTGEMPAWEMFTPGPSTYEGEGH